MPGYHEGLGAKRAPATRSLDDFAADHLLDWNSVKLSPSFSLITPAGSPDFAFFLCPAHLFVANCKLLLIHSPSLTPW
jgi:hypothetical protein